MTVPEDEREVSIKTDLMTFHVYSPGTKVLLADGEVNGVILEVLISHAEVIPRVSYKVEYWSNGQMHADWFDALTIDCNRTDEMWQVRGIC